MREEIKVFLFVVAIGFSTIVACVFIVESKEIEIHQLQTERHLKEWELKTRIEEAKAEQAKLRVKELEMLCNMVTPSGEVYLDKEC